MQRDLKHGTFRDVISNSTPPIAEIAQQLREVLEAIHQDIVEVPKPAQGHAAYGVAGARTNGIFSYICPMEEYVRLGLYYGAALPDPAGLLEGKGKRLRHLKIYALADADQPVVQQLLAAAFEERKNALDLNP